MVTRGDFFKIRLKGPDASPDLVPAVQLAEVMKAVDAMLRGLIALRHPGISEDAVVVGLVQISRRSVGLAFSSNFKEAGGEAAAEVSYAVKKRDLSTLPASAAEKLGEIFSFAAKRKWDTHLSARTSGGLVTATVHPDTRFIVPTPTVIQGETTLYGEVERAGGTTPVISLRLPNDERISCQVSRELAREFGHRLYQFVGVVGTARWSTPGFKLEAFTALRITEYEDTPPSLAVAELAAVLREHWAGTDDVLAEVRKLRQSEDLQ
jgi:hypothetical protein